MQRTDALHPGDIDRGSLPRYRSTRLSPGRFLAPPSLPRCTANTRCHTLPQKETFIALGNRPADRPGDSSIFSLFGARPREWKVRRITTHSTPLGAQLVHGPFEHIRLRIHSLAGLIARMIISEHRTRSPRSGMNRVNDGAAILHGSPFIFARITFALTSRGKTAPKIDGLSDNRTVYIEVTKQKSSVPGS